MSKIYEIESTVGLDLGNCRIVNVLLRAIKHSLPKVHDAEKSWRFIFEDIRDGMTEPFLAINLTSVGGSESDNALSKINTLKRHIDIANTGDSKRQAFYGPDDIVEYGGIRVPYSGYARTCEKDDVLSCITGNIYIAFSGAHEYINLSVAVGVLSEFLEYQNNDESTLFDYDLSIAMEDKLIDCLSGALPFWF